MRTNQQHNQHHFLRGIPGIQSQCSGYFVLAPTVGLTYAVWNKFQKVLCEQQVSECQEAI